MGYPIYNNAGQVIGQRENLSTASVTWASGIPQDGSFVYAVNSSGQYAVYSIFSGRLSSNGVTPAMSAAAKTSAFAPASLSIANIPMPYLIGGGIAIAALIFLMNRG